MKHKTKLYNGERLWYAHVKRDGNWLTVEKDPCGVVTCTSSIGTKLTHQLKHLSWLLNIHKYVPSCTILHGELWMRGKPASYVKTAIKEKQLALKFDVFAVETLPAGASLEYVQSCVELWCLSFVPFATLDDDAYLPERVFEHLKIHHGERDIEGIVFKNSNLGAWYKWKPTRTIDLIVHDFIDGAGKYIGLIGSMVCKTCEGHVIANVSGMDDLTRATISLDEDDYKNKIVEVEYQCIGSKGKLRHPRFKRFRDDKKFGECGISQDPDLQRFYHAQIV